MKPSSDTVVCEMSDCARLTQVPVLIYISLGFLNISQVRRTGLGTWLAEQWKKEPEDASTGQRVGTAWERFESCPPPLCVSVDTLHCPGGWLW